MIMAVEIKIVVTVMNGLEFAYRMRIERAGDIVTYSIDAAE